MTAEEALELVQGYLASPVAGPLAEEARLCNLLRRVQKELPARDWPRLFHALGLKCAQHKVLAGQGLTLLHDLTPRHSLEGWLRGERARLGATFGATPADGHVERHKAGGKRAHRRKTA